MTSFGVLSKFETNDEHLQILSPVRMRNAKNKQRYIHPSPSEPLLDFPGDGVTRAPFNKEGRSQFNHVILEGLWTQQIKDINLHCTHGLCYPTSVDCVYISCDSPGAHLFPSGFSAWMIGWLGLFPTKIVGIASCCFFLPLIFLTYLLNIFISILHYSYSEFVRSRFYFV